MTESLTLSIPPFRLDLASQRLWCGADQIELEPKAIEMLVHLVRHPRRLISTQALREAVWGGISISADTIPSTMRELRRALGEDAKSPRFIETVHGRGYRFIGAFGAGLDGQADQPDAFGALAGRELARDTLREWLERSSRGESRVGFVVGEAGIGKTALVDAFVAELRDRGDVLCALGQCVNRYGGGDPYVPLLEALGRICRGPGGRRCIDLLAHNAPTWLRELPGILEAGEATKLAAGMVRIGRDRMLGELEDAVRAICEQQPLVLLLEDLHWSDAATLDAIGTLARRPDPRRLLIVGTCRQHALGAGRGEEARLADLRAELRAHELSDELELGLLSEAGVARYIEARFPDLPSPHLLRSFEQLEEHRGQEPGEGR